MLREDVIYTVIFKKRKRNLPSDTYICGFIYIYRKIYFTKCLLKVNTHIDWLTKEYSSEENINNEFFPTIICWD